LAAALAAAGLHPTRRLTSTGLLRVATLPSASASRTSRTLPATWSLWLPALLTLAAAHSGSAHHALAAAHSGSAHHALAAAHSGSAHHALALGPHHALALGPHHPHSDHAGLLLALRVLFGLHQAEVRNDDHVIGVGKADETHQQNEQSQDPAFHIQ
jgi:hypothetical protein